jgi:ABC-type Fe3+-hydroxamate transport system substrate-binding protein
MMEFTDQLNRTIKLGSTPKRIISIVPSQTELLYDLGLDREVVGITKFCVHPESWFRNKTRIGGTKMLNLEKIASLEPDLILANKEENVQEQVDALSAVAPVWTSDIRTLQDALEMIRSIGKIVGKESKAGVILKDIDAKFGRTKSTTTLGRALYLIWQEPYMAAGSDTFISDMLERSGFENCVRETRYPSLEVEAIQALNPEYILLSSEPYPFKEKQAREIQLLFPTAKVLLVDGEMFSWYGSRLMHAPAYFESLFKRSYSVI